MQRTKQGGWGWLVSSCVVALQLGALGWLTGCNAPDVTSRVSYGAANGVGEWPPEDAGVDAAHSAHSRAHGGLRTDLVEGGIADTEDDSGSVGTIVAMGGAGRTGTIADASVQIVPSAPSSMRFQVLTHSLGGHFAPRNVGAIWIENSAGQFVETLACWATIRKPHLDRFVGPPAFGSVVDAVTGATLPNHQMHAVSWNLRDASGNPAPDGAYKLFVELNDDDRPASFVSFDFMKDGVPHEVAPPDTPYFTAVKLTLE